MVYILFKICLLIYFKLKNIYTKAIATWPEEADSSWGIPPTSSFLLFSHETVSCRHDMMWIVSVYEVDRKRLRFRAIGEHVCLLKVLWQKPSFSLYYFYIIWRNAMERRISVCLSVGLSACFISDEENNKITQYRACSIQINKNSFILK